MTTIKTALKSAEAKSAAKAPKTNAKVLELIATANKAGDTLLGAVREAAFLAVKQLPKGMAFAEGERAIKAMYSDAFTNGYARQQFGNMLLLALAPKEPVTIVTGKGDKQVETHTTAAQAATMSKDATTQAAQQVRATHTDKSRAPGAGRKPKQPTTAPTQATSASKADPAVLEAGPVAHATAEEVWLANVAAYMADSVMAERVREAFADIGWTLTPPKAPRRAK